MLGYHRVGVRIFHVGAGSARERVSSEPFAGRARFYNSGNA